MTSISIAPVRGVPMVQAGDDLAALLLDAIAASDLALKEGDILAVAQKIVSKAEGRLVRLADVTASAAATELAEKVEKDPRLVQLILDESTEVVRHNPGVLIVRHRLGLVGAHAGIDQSNIEHGEGEEGAALLLPEDPDASAARLREAIRAATGIDIGILITDSANRPGDSAPSASPSAPPASTCSTIGAAATTSSAANSRSPSSTEPTASPPPRLWRWGKRTNAPRRRSFEASRSNAMRAKSPPR